MSLPASFPKLPKWIFFATDAALLLAAGFIAKQSAQPLSTQAVFAIVACLFAGAIIALVPLVAHYEREKNEQLDDRQRALEALAQTITAAAEQIGIAANGLNELTDLTHKNLKQAEHLPHKLQEKIAAFQAQLDQARTDDREELEKELAELRASESERLAAAADSIQKSAVDLAKLQAAAPQHLAAASSAALSQISDTLASAQAEAIRALDENRQASLAAIKHHFAAQADAAGTALDAKFTALTAAAVAGIATALAQPLVVTVDSPSTSAPASAPASTPGPVVESTANLAPQGPADNDAAEASAPAATEPTSALLVAATPPPAKRARKTRREEPAPAAPAEPGLTPATSPQVAPAPSSPADNLSASSAVTPTPIGLPPAATATEPSPSPEPANAFAPTSSDPAPSAPEHSSPPLASAPTALASDLPSVESPLPAPAATEPPAPLAVDTPEIGPPSDSPSQLPAPAVANSDELHESEVKPAKKRPAKKNDADDTVLPLGLDLGEEPAAAVSDDAQISPDETPEHVLTSDGATRLLVTAYIGIGNRLFIRGDGPGLSWEKGVPLQFVSIGKWRWESAEASASVAYRLFKNDDVECAALGPRTLAPGHQHEVTAKF